MRKNRNRGYKKLTVWNDAIDYYVLTCEVFRSFEFELKRVVSQQIASVDSVHRNIAEGYRRRSIKEYLNFLNIALGSFPNCVGGDVCNRRLHYRKSGVVGYGLFEIRCRNQCKVGRNKVQNSQEKIHKLSSCDFCAFLRP